MRKLISWVIVATLLCAVAVGFGMFFSECALGAGSATLEVSLHIVTAPKTKAERDARAAKDLADLQARNEQRWLEQQANKKPAK